MKAIKCILIFHGRWKEINMGQFESISAAKRYVREVYWERPYSIIKHNQYE